MVKQMYRDHTIFLSYDLHNGQVFVKTRPPGGTEGDDSAERLFFTEPAAIKYAEAQIDENCQHLEQLGILGPTDG